MSIMLCLSATVDDIYQSDDDPIIIRCQPHALHSPRYKAKCDCARGQKQEHDRQYEQLERSALIAIHRNVTVAKIHHIGSVLQQNAVKLEREIMQKKCSGRILRL